LVFLCITVFETKAAADNTKEALNEAKENSRRELGAYLHATNIQFNDIDEFVPTMTLFIKNTGQTPAHWFEVAYISETRITGKGAVPYTEVINFSKARDFSGWGCIASQEELKVKIDSFSDITGINDAHRRGVELVVFGNIRYKTVFGEIFETQFAFSSSAPKVEGFLNRPPVKIKTYRKTGDDDGEQIIGQLS